MKVYRKPSTALWYYDSAERVANLKILPTNWTEEIEIVFDATKDKSRSRHTDMKILLTEIDVMTLYRGLVKGKKENERKELGKLKNECKTLRNKLIAEEKACEAVLLGHSVPRSWYTKRANGLMEKWIGTRFGSRSRRTHTHVYKLRLALRKYIEAHGTKKG